MNQADLLSPRDQHDLESLFRKHGYTDYRWFDPEPVVAAQWIRMKCMFGYPN